MPETYAESPDGQRTVQYFDKSRMENNSWHAVEAPWDVTNGLLVVEMVDGRPAGASLHREREAVSRSSLDTRLARLARYEQLMGHEVRIE